jgi:hypothetical protein
MPFARNIAICALLAGLSLFAACSAPVPTVGLDLPQPAYLQEDNPSGSSAVKPSDSAATDPPPTGVSQSSNPGYTRPTQTAASVQPTRADDTTAPTVPPPSAATVPPTTPPPTAPLRKLPVPSGNAQIAAYYNDVTRLVNASRAGFRKTNTTTVSDITGLDQLGAVRTFAEKPILGKVDEFLGTGTRVSTATKGQATNYLVTASLGVGDLVSASCKESGNNYILTLKINGVDNPTRDSSNSLGRYTADFNTAAEGKATIEAGMKITLITVKPTVGSVNMAANQSTITCKMDKYTGRAVEIHHQFSFNAEILTVVAKAIGMEFEVDKASGVSSTDVTYTSFQF